MKLAKIAVVIAIALPMASAFAANESADTGTNQTQAAAPQHKWYEAGEFALQAEKERAALDRAGFPQYNY
jgi:hypothetical protein